MNAGPFAHRLSGGPGDLQDHPERAYYDRGLHAYEHSCETVYLASEPRHFVDEVIWVRSVIKAAINCIKILCPCDVTSIAHGIKEF